jgi:hypothetical protein
MTAEVKTTTGKAAHYTAGFFITRVVQLLPDGRQLLLHSRWHRKGLPPVQVGSDGTALRVAPVANPWLQLWAPHRIAWWIALLFIIGSACFALGSFASNWPHYCPLWLTNSPIINTVFFVGSLFFTGAAWLQLLEAINGDVADIGTSTGTQHRRWRWFAWKPHNAGYSASLIQFVGTLLFNFNTAEWLWGANLFTLLGALCFFVASYLMIPELFGAGRATDTLSVTPLSDARHAS